MASSRQQQPAGRRKGTDTSSAGGVDVAEYKAELWRMADALRGSMDAAEYKHVVLGLIFLKYISDAFEEARRSWRPSCSVRHRYRHVCGSSPAVGATASGARSLFSSTRAR